MDIHHDCYFTDETPFETPVLSIGLIVLLARAVSKGIITTEGAEYFKRLERKY